MLKFLKSVRKLAKTGPKRHFRNKLMETKVAGNYLLRFIYIYIYIYSNKFDYVYGIELYF